MASIRLDPPEQFDFKQPDNWSAWKKRFDQYQIASGLSEEGEPKQVCVLLYCLGPGIVGVSSVDRSYRRGPEEVRTVCEKLDTFLSVRQNVIFERARFNLRNQLPGESAKEYILSLYILAESCKYGTFKQEMIRDRLVVEIRDRHLSERLQMDADLTLESAMKVIHQKEAMREQQHVLGSSTKDDLIVVDEVNCRQNSGAVRHGLRFPKCKQKSLTCRPPVPKQEELYCTRCGKAPAQPLKNCPAREAECFRCKKKGHFSKQCRMKEVESVETEKEKLQSVYLDTLTLDQLQVWTVNVAVGSTTLQFKIDTAAEVNAIMEQSYRLLKGVHLHKTLRKLYGPNKSPLDVSGMFTHTLMYNNRSSSQEKFVVRGLKRNLLGLPAIQL